MWAWDVFDGNGEHIDTVFFTDGFNDWAVRRMLIDHDGYDESITVARTIIRINCAD